MIEHYFVLPENSHLPSGGNRYNEFLIRALKKKRLPLSTGSLTQVLRAVRQDLRKWIWVDSLYLPRLPILMEAATPRQRVFMIVHHLPSFEPDLGKAEAGRVMARERKSLSEVEGFLVTSLYVKDLLLQRGLKRKRFVVVPPALCLTSSGRKKEPKRFRGLMAANLIAQKGILEFLRSLEKEVESEDEFIIDIAGRHDIEPDYAEACFDHASRSPSLGRSIRFLGPVSMEKMKRLYLYSSALISASKMETYGMAIKEAQAFGLPVLAYDGGYVREHILPGVNGILCSTFPELAGTCVEFIRKPEKLKALSAHPDIFRSEMDYTWERAAEKFIEQTSGLSRES